MREGVQVAPKNSHLNDIENKLVFWWTLSEQSYLNDLTCDFSSRWLPDDSGEHRYPPPWYTKKEDLNQKLSLIIFRPEFNFTLDKPKKLKNTRQNFFRNSFSQFTQNGAISRQKFIK